MAEISRPVKCAELRVMGLDDTAQIDEVREAVAEAGQCSIETVKCGKIRRGPSGLGAVLVRCPVGAAKILVDGGK